MSTYTIQKFKSPSGDIYKFKDGVSGYTTNTGTVTKVTAGTGLAIGTTSGGNFTTSGTINHVNSITAQTTQAVYPIKIDAQGHISAYGSAVTIPTVPSSMSGTTASSETGISIADHSTTSIYGVSSSTTSVTGVSGSDTASYLTTGSAATTSFKAVNAAGSGSYTQGSFSGGSFEQGDFSGGSGSFSATVTNHVLSFSHTHTAATHGSDTFTAATHGADSHTHTAPTTTTITVGTVTVPQAASSATTVPIKNSSSTTVVTSKTHLVTDDGHTHTVTVS